MSQPLLESIARITLPIIPAFLADHLLLLPGNLPISDHGKISGKLQRRVWCQSNQASIDVGVGDVTSTTPS